MQTMQNSMETHFGKIERIAVFSVSAGSGHVRAAQALKAAADLWHPDVEVVHVDLMELVPKLFRTIILKPISR
jgi:processive 1,2-diacylglycerol beta-glucosyltransferase